MKTCSDTFQYMNYTENSSAAGGLSGVDSLADRYIEVGFNVPPLLLLLFSPQWHLILVQPMLTSQGHESRIRSQFFRRRGKARRSKHTSKSAGYHFIRKRIAERNGQLYQQYNPCGCQSACGKDCPCLKNETCCEKYCG
jgi:histone-lysine N-methyltransferase EZH2